MNCTSLYEVIIEDKSKLIETIDYSKPDRLPPYQFVNALRKKYGYNLANVTNKCSSIQCRAFLNCKSLKHKRFFLVNLEYFNENAFENCSSLHCIETNSIYFKLILYPNFRKSAFVGTPDDIALSLFSNNKCLNVSFSIHHLPRNIQSDHRSRKRFEFPEKVKELMIWPASEENEKVKKFKEKRPRQTCLNVFDGPYQALH